ncbi:hypothetical protein QAD02_005722 [Eretmocerus hayati]|uniref:Uncharacterized protein n=1 Tax=Eretmocerus hayati TaxID=131215 RepID=A0ACC2NY45_9HYME|nr:hypothetical protein QAD02_005722 [Eretmocerus hayati]
MGAALRTFRLGFNKYLITWMDLDLGDPTFVGERNGMPAVLQAHMKFITVKIVGNGREEVGCQIENFETVIPYYEGKESKLVKTLTVQLNDNNFDVIYHTFGKSGGKFTRERFDITGKRLLGPTDAGDDDVQVTAKVVDPNWMYKSEVFDNQCLHSQERHGLTTFRELKSIQDTVLTGDFAKLRGWSISNGYRRLCTLKTLEISECNYIKSGYANDPLPSIFTIQFDHLVETQIIYNLADGGLLAMTRAFRDGKDSTHFYVTKFDANGTGYKSIDFLKVHSNPSSSLGHIFEDSNGEYCFALLLKGINSRFVVKCYNDEALMIPKPSPVRAQPVEEHLTS